MPPAAFGRQLCFLPKYAWPRPQFHREEQIQALELKIAEEEKAFARMVGPSAQELEEREMAPEPAPTETPSSSSGLTPSQMLIPGSGAGRAPSPIGGRLAGLLAGQGLSPEPVVIRRLYNAIHWMPRLRLGPGCERGIAIRS